MSLENIADLYEVSSKAIIVRSTPNSALGDYEFLLLERDADFGGRFWDFPGGRLHHVNNLHNALCREVSEELGQELKFNEGISYDEDVDIVAHGFWHGKGHPVIMLYQLIEIEKTNLDPDNFQLSDEHHSFRWFTDKEIAWNGDFAGAELEEHTSKTLCKVLKKLS